MIKQTALTSTLITATVTALSNVASAENKFEFPIQQLPKVTIPLKAPLISGTVGRKLYSEVNENIAKKCPSLDLQSIDCDSHSAYFTSCSIISQPYQTGHNTIVDIKLAKFETVRYSHQEMMAQFLSASIHRKQESTRIWIENGRKAISGKEMIELSRHKENPNRLINIRTSSISKAIHKASFFFDKQCAIEKPSPSEKTESSLAPKQENRIKPQKNMLG
jgi:hypothetical protein